MAESRVPKSRLKQSIEYGRVRVRQSRLGSGGGKLGMGLGLIGKVGGAAVMLDHSPRLYGLKERGGGGVGGWVSEWMGG